MNSATNGGSGGVPGGDMDGWVIVSNGGTNGYAPDNKRIWNIDKWHVWVGNMRVGVYTVAGSTVTAVKEDWYVAGRRVEPSDRLGSNLSGGVRLLPYGEELQPPAVANGRTKFATYERDAATGMDYADQRWYGPGTGRFTTEDPYLASGGAESPGSWNRFAYVEGDPINFMDPWGLCRGSVNVHYGGSNGMPSGYSSISVCADFEPVPYWYASYGSGSGYTDANRPPWEAAQNARESGFCTTPYGMSCEEFDRLRAMCATLPDAGVFSSQVTLGFLAGNSISMEVVVNYRSGDVTGFFSVGMQVAPLAGGQLQGGTGFVWGIGTDNSKYASLGTSGSVTVGTGVVAGGLQLSVTSGGIANPIPDWPSMWSVVALQATVSVGIEQFLPLMPRFSASNTVGSMSLGRLGPTLGSALPGPHGALFNMQQSCSITR